MRLFLVIVAAISFCFGGTGCGPPITSQNHPMLGAPVSPVTLARLEESSEGETLTFPEPGRVVVVYFWGSFCPPCMEQLPALSKLFETYRGESVSFFGVSIDLELDNARAVTAPMDLNFPLVWDRDGGARVAFGIGNHAPRLFLFDGTGRMRLFFGGGSAKSGDKGQQLEMLKRAIDSLL